MAINASFAALDVIFDDTLKQLPPHSHPIEI